MALEMTIELPNGRKIGPDEPCFIVAEIGQNHQGDAYTALRLITMAHEAGVDAVKLCKRHIPSDLTRAAYNAPYPGPQSFGPTYGKHREALELSIEEYTHLQERMRYNEYPEVFFATACDQKSVDKLEEHIKPPMYKIASRDLDNLPLIEYVARLGKPVVLSTGMARSEREIELALDAVHRDRYTGGPPVVLMHCVSKYPLPDDEAMLSQIDRLRKEFGCLVGYSDHTIGIHIGQAAVQSGAVMIEKHITLARAMPGTDHAGSLEPDGLKKFVRNIRATYRATWDSPIDQTEIEANRRKLGRSLVSARAIRPGETITEDMLCLKSPGDGIRWVQRDRVVGHVARVLIPADVTIQNSDVMSKTPETPIHTGP